MKAGRLIARLILAAASAATLSAGLARAASYPAMAPVDQYLMPDRNAEIALAKSAAPVDISDQATVLILTRHGYETAVKGTNGFVCAVERGWMGPFEHPEFWNPAIRGPLCFNPPAARSILPYTYKRTELVLAGRSKDQVMAGMKTALDAKQLPKLEVGAMTFMMSKDQNLGDRGGHYTAHLMFYLPQQPETNFGGQFADVPMGYNPQFEHSPEAMSVLMVMVPRWSDGEPVPMSHH